jgi:hypothetical protein
MEGNLTRARSSLYITPSGSLSSIHSSSPLSRSTPSPPQDERRIIPALGISPAKHRQLHTPADTPNGSPGHSRVYSENSIYSTLRTVPFPVRSASAAARYMSKGDGSQPSPPMPHSPDQTAGDPRSASRSVHTPALNKSSPPHGVTLEPLSEDEVVPEFEVDPTSVRSSMDGYLSPNGEHRVLTRSTSSMQMRDLRDQMQDLKGRLSVLRDRARDDTMKRRSLQSLRTPSPFTAAEQWFATSKSYGEPLSADAGVAHAPWKEETGRETQAKNELGNDITPPQVPEYANSDATSIYEDVLESHHATDGLNGSHEATIAEEGQGYDTALEEERENVEDDIDNDYNDEIVNRDEADDYESDASLYHDSLATPISHEDREDAFDYEHFFLHSAMGTISQQRHGRSDSVGSFSSEDSVETTRGPPIPTTTQQAEKIETERAALGHFRSESTDSVSTIATFATATEGHGSDSGNDEEQDSFAVQQVDAPLRSTTPVTAKRSTFGTPVKNEPSNDGQPPPMLIRRSSSVIHDHEQRNGSSVHRPSVASFDSFESVGTVRSFPLVNKPKSQEAPNSSSNPDLREAGSLLSDSVTLTDAAGERLQPSPVHMLAKEDQIMVERLVASLGKCVLGLQEAGRASYEGRVWRRRLDAARRVLEGQEGAV